MSSQTDIRPFRVDMPEEAIVDLRQRIAATGWDPDRIARAWAVLMERLGYTRYVAQGGDWGTAVSAAMARQASKGLLGIYFNEAERGGHFAAWEQPQLFSQELRAAFRALR